MEQIKAYKPETSSICSGQVLQCPYDTEKGKLIVREMTDQLVLELVEKKLVTDQMILTVGYDIDNLTDAKTSALYHGEITTDRYGRKTPKHAHGTVNLDRQTSSARIITEAVMKLYEQIVDPGLLIRRVTLVANRLANESQIAETGQYEQLDLFTDYAALEREREEEKKKLSKERNLQEAVLSVRKKYGKNAILKGMNLLEGATTMDRNRQIGGHRA